MPLATQVGLVNVPLGDEFLGPHDGVSISFRQLLHDAADHLRRPPFLAPQRGDILEDGVVVGAFGRFAHQRAGAGGMVEDQGCRAAHGEGSRQQRVSLEVEPRFDFGREFVTEIQEPPSVKRQIAGLTVEFFLCPARVECLEEPGVAGNERLARKCKQDVKSTKLAAARGAL